MRRFIAFAFGFAVAACGVPGVAVAQPAEDSVVGHFFDFADPEIDPNASEIVADVNVRSGASGENPSGSATWASRVDRWTASEISCLAVNGRTAVIGFSGELIDIFFEDNDEVIPIRGLLRIVDGGGPNSARDSFEWALLTQALAEPPLPGPTDCSSYPSIFGPTHGPVLNRQGDVVVTDAQPLPSTKQDCKNGSWRNFGVFKNQGDCVSFVATGGKNPPANSP
jgi:hypothetical protein